MSPVRDLRRDAPSLGWPAPAWLATGQAPAGEAWVVQEFIDGRPPPRLDDFVAEQMSRILGLQAAMFPGATGGWGHWAAGVVFEDWHGLRDWVARGVPGGPRWTTSPGLPARARTWWRELQPGQHHRRDGPTLGGRRRGPRCPTARLRPGRGAAGRRARPCHRVRRGPAVAYAAGLDRREFAVYAGSVGLTMAESFLRHDRMGEAAGAVPGMVRALKQTLSLAGA